MTHLKQTFCLLLSVVMVLGMLTGCDNSKPESNNSSDPSQEVTSQQSAVTERPSVEVARAIAYGLVPEEIQGDYDKTITHRQYCEMLTNVIRTCDEGNLAAWEKTIALAAQSDKEMLREDGILVTAFALVHIGKIEYSGADREFFDTVCAYRDEYGFDLTWDYPLFPAWDDTVFEWINCNYIMGGLTMCAVEKSRVSGLPIYPYDFEREGKHFLDQLSREEAICAVLRFAETEDIYANNVPLPENIDFSDSEKWEEEFLALVEARKQSILNNNETVPCTGTAYYVSNSGNDWNSGRSPENAWATIDRVNRADLREGDTIYFERGGLWRGGFVYREGIAYAAYGSGEKPKFYGSPENGSGADEWSLWKEDGDTKIWKYNNTIPECGGIVLGDTSTIAKRVFSWYDGYNHYFTDDLTKPFDIAQALYVDLSFYCDISLPECELPFDPRPYFDESTLYLRCDNGNPGELYPSIEFMCANKVDNVALIHLGKGGMLDNLCIMYYCGTAVFIGDGCTVQNCEIAYCTSTCFEFFIPETPGDACLWTDGNAIHYIASDTTIRNNYIHDTDGHGINFEIGGDYEGNYARMPYSGNITSGNLIERVSEPMYIANNQDGLDDAVAFDGLIIEDNYCLYSGYGWYDAPLSNINPSTNMRLTLISLNFGGRSNMGEHTIRVENNVFYRAVNSLVCTVGQEENIPVFENNVFAQSAGHVVLRTAGPEFCAMEPEQTQEKVWEQYGNAAGKVYVLRP